MILCRALQELVRARRRLQQRRLPGVETSEDQGEQNLTLVMIIIIVIFVVCQSPAFGNQLLYYLIGDEQYACGKVSRCRASRAGRGGKGHLSYIYRRCREDKAWGETGGFVPAQH